MVYHGVSDKRPYHRAMKTKLFFLICYTVNYCLNVIGSFFRANPDIIPPQTHLSFIRDSVLGHPGH